MKKVGFIDYYLHEWHADHFPTMLADASNGEYQVCYAWAYCEPPVNTDRISNGEWAKRHGIELLDSIEELVEKSDCIVVLSPNNPEVHEELCELPLKSGKPTFIDKTFATDKESAERIFQLADEYGTKCFSASALFFSEELEDVDIENLYKIYSEGPANIDLYAVHQLEPMIRLMNVPAKRLMFLGDEAHPSLIIEFEDGRFAQMYHRNDETWSFCFTAVYADNTAKRYEMKSDHDGRFIKAMVQFFETGVAPVSHELTINAIAVRAAAMKASTTPFQWFDV